MVTRGRRLVMSVTVAALVALVGVTTARSQATTAAACGAATTSTVIAADEFVARGIYLGELASDEVSTDMAHVEGSKALLIAVADHNKAAVHAATKKLVLRPAWHIVRLRILSNSGAVLADVGGAHVIAPVSGKLTSHGTVVGSFVMSVQDDIGYELLVTRFTNLPIELYFDDERLLGTLFPYNEAPAKAPPANTAITVNGHPSLTVSYTANAFPSGTLTVLLAVPKPSVALAKETCAAVSASTYGIVAEYIAAQYVLPREYRSFVTLDHAFGPSMIFVRSGSTQLAGTSADGPKKIPLSGNFTYAGQQWDVFSFVAKAPARVYLLFPASLTPTGSTDGSGASGSAATTGASGTTS
jgi:hypothetical protein